MEKYWENIGRNIGEILEKYSEILGKLWENIE
jgi:hypothetical protein